MDRNWSLAAAAALGAGTMFMLDPNRGARRRALVRDKLVRAAHNTGEGLETTARDAANRARGAAAEVRGKVRREHVDDIRLAARVRSELGRFTSHPRAITVTAMDGRVEVEGPILSDEAERLLAAVRAVRGVASVEDRLERHDSAENVPALQGGSTRPGRRSPLLQESWSPTARAVAGLAGVAIAMGAVLAAQNRQQRSEFTSGRSATA